MLKESIGLITLCIGVAMGDSEKLWLPIFLILVGAVLLLGSRDKGDY